MTEKPKEFYSREEHKSVLDERQKAGKLVDASGHTPDEKAYFKEEKALLEKRHKELLNRAWTEALMVNERIDATRVQEDAQKQMTEDYAEAKKEYAEKLQQIPSNTVSYFTNQELFPSEIKGVAEVSVRSDLSTIPTHTEPAFDITLAFPVLVSQGQNPEVEERKASLRVSPTGDIEGWESAPLHLRADVEGKRKVLGELLRCLAERNTGIPVYFTAEDLVSGGIDEDQSGGKGEGPYNGPDGFEAEERFEILMSHKPLFVCQKKDMPKMDASAQMYSAFVFPNAIVFDSPYYRNATYFLRIKSEIPQGVVDGLKSLPQDEQTLLMEKILRDNGFNEEIKLTKPERRAKGNRYGAYHPRRPADATDREYAAKLQKYYAELFELLQESPPAKREGVAN